MSQEIVELTREWTEAFRARRVPEEILAPGFVMENAATAVTEQTYRGAAGVERWFGDFFGVLEDGWRYDLELIEIGDDWAVAKITLNGRGRVRVRRSTSRTGASSGPRRGR